ncbi:MAG: type II toxin-antitoxin system RelE/ParE family toxin [Elusimicrobiota bacterium]
MKKVRKIYRTASGFSPFEEWFEALRDVVGCANIMVRLDRADSGNFGDHRSVGAGVVELRIHYGPGYRLYLAQQGPEIIVLLLGGDKNSQPRDVERAHEYWKDYKRRK